MCILHLGKNGLDKYRLAKKWEQFKIVLLFMDHPVHKLCEQQQAAGSLNLNVEAIVSVTLVLAPVSLLFLFPSVVNMCCCKLYYCTVRNGGRKPLSNLCHRAVTSPLSTVTSDHVTPVTQSDQSPLPACPQ